MPASEPSSPKPAVLQHQQDAPVTGALGKYTMNNTPLDVREIDFHGSKLQTFMHEGEPHVAMRSVVEAMGMNWGTQADKLRGEARKFNCTLMGTVAEDGRNRSMLAMPVRKLPLWMASINPNKIKDAVRRSRVILFQEESAIALHDYWTHGVAMKDDAAGIVTEIAPDAMRAIGGMVKGIVGKGLTETVPQLVQQTVNALVPQLVTQAIQADRRIAAVEFEPASAVVWSFDVPQKGRRSLVYRVSAALRDFSIKNDFPMRRSAESNRWLFSVDAVQHWLNKGGGRQMINQHKDRAEGKQIYLVFPGGRAEGA